VYDGEGDTHDLTLYAVEVKRIEGDQVFIVVNTGEGHSQGQWRIDVFLKYFEPQDQPMPEPNTGTVSAQDLVIADIERRKAVGLSRYGTLLFPNNGRSMLRDAYDEALDLCVYLRGLIAEEES